jgi:hypothetical protein
MISQYLQILEIKTESPELISALNTLSDFYDDNNPAARRQLRSTIEQKGLDINKQFLAAAEGVIEVRSGTKPHHALLPSEVEGKAAAAHIPTHNVDL